MTPTRIVKPSPNFKKLTADMNKGAIIKPLLKAALFDGNMPRVLIDLDPKGHNLDFGPDGTFHPSTHPLMAPRMLYWYLVEPEGWISEPMEFMGTLSVTIGKIMHTVINATLWSLDLLIAPGPGDPEPSVTDPITGASGNYDGELKLVLPQRDLSRQIFEFKTASPLTKFPDDLDLAEFKRKWPQYYAQVQEYMRMTGLRIAIVLFMAMGYPWEMAEFHVPFDPAFAQGVTEKYVDVRSHAAERIMPPPCCGVGSKQAKVCPARAVCPVGIAS